MREPIRFRAEWIFRLLDPDGSLAREVRVPNFLTELGEAHIADQLSEQDADPMSHIAIGSGAGQTATDTALDAELARVALDSGFPAQGTGASDSDVNRIIRDNEVLYKSTFAAGTGTGTVTEAAVFNSGTTGTMFNYSVLSPPIVKGASQSLLVVIVLTIGVS